MEQDCADITSIKGPNLHFHKEDQPDLFNSPFSMNFTMSSNYRNIRMIREMGVNSCDNNFKIDEVKMDYSPIFNNNIKDNNNFIVDMPEGEKAYKGEEPTKKRQV